MRFLKKRLLKKTDFFDVTLYVLISIVFFSGTIYGVINADNNMVDKIISTAPTSETEIFITSYLKNIRLIAWISLFSLSAIGFPGILYFDYVKGYSLGVSVYTIISASQNGVLVTLVSFIPFLICNITAVVLVSKYGGKLSFYILNLLLNYKIVKNDKYNVLKFALAAAISSILMALSGLTELLILKSFTNV